MPKCQKVRVKRRELCVGDLTEVITLESRNITPPNFNLVDFDEQFTNSLQVWAGVETQTGKTFFDGVNTDTPITHIIYIVYDATVTAQTWIVLEDLSRLDILKVEDLDERHEWMKLTCVDRGLLSREASKS